MQWTTWPKSMSCITLVSCCVSAVLVGKAFELGFANIRFVRYFMSMASKQLDIQPQVPDLDTRSK